MSEVVLDANVLVAWLDEQDSLHDRATALLDRLEAAGYRLVLVDVMLFECISVVCRRARQRKRPPDLALVTGVARRLGP